MRETCARKDTVGFFFPIDPNNMSIRSRSDFYQPR